MTQPTEQLQADPSDGALLARFITYHDQDAFAQLVRRHGGMVVGVLLGCNTSTASMRLTRGRQMLRDRLVKEGIAVSAVGVIAVLAGQASADVAPTFVTSVSQLAVSVAAGNAAAAATSGSVAALSRGALNMLFWAKMKIAAMIVGAAIIAGGAGAMVIQQALAASAPTLLTST